MKTLELRERKNTTEFAVKQALEFFGTFDLTSASDVSEIRSEYFNIRFDLTGCGYMQYKAAFVNDAGILRFELPEKEKYYSLDTVFDGTCEFINFRDMMNVFEKFIHRLNELIEKKESDISEFLQFVEEYEGMKELNRQIDDFDKNNVEVK